MNRSFGQKIGDFGLALGGDYGALQGVRDRRKLEQDDREARLLARGARNKEMSGERKQAMAMDFRNIATAIDAGQQDRARTMLNDRIRVGSMLPDFDPVSSNYLKDLLDSGNPQSLNEAREFLDFEDQMAVQSGFIEPRPKEEAYTLAEGAERWEGGELIASNPRAVIEKPPTTEKDRNGVLRYTSGPNAGKEVFEGIEDPKIQVPPTLIEALTPERQALASELFQTVGGGQAGVEAVNKMVDRDFASAEEEDTRNKARGVQLSAINLATSILSNPEWEDVVGPLQGRGANIYGMADTGNTMAVSDIEELENILTADNLSLMSGVLSESDMAIIRSVAGGGLDRRRSEPEFQRRVEQIILSLARSIDLSPDEMRAMTPEQRQQYKQVLDASLLKEAGN